MSMATDNVKAMPVISCSVTLLTSYVTNHTNAEPDEIATTTKTTRYANLWREPLYAIQPFLSETPVAKPA